MCREGYFTSGSSETGCEATAQILGKFIQDIGMYVITGDVKLSVTKEDGRKALFYGLDICLIPGSVFRVSVGDLRSYDARCVFESVFSFAWCITQHMQAVVIATEVATSVLL